MKQATPAVLYDACVLYPALLRDFLMWLGLSGCCRARWSRTIQDEWKRNLLRNRPNMHRAQLDRVSELMDNAIPDCLVEGYEALIADVSLPDPDDRHVLAAAIHGDASVIVTFNLRDFPREALTPFSIEARHPDDFILDLLERDAAAVISAARHQRAQLVRSPSDTDRYLEILRRQGLIKTAQALTVYRDGL